MVQPLLAGYVFDPTDPRAPSREQWDRMSLDDRAYVRELLNSEGSTERVNEALRQKLEETQRRLNEEQRGREKAERRREEAEQALAEARAEIARLKGH